MGELALVLGASGGVGGEIAAALLRRGWAVRGMARDPVAAAARAALPGVSWVRGDAMNADDVARAATGAAVIVHGVNPPRYERWGELVLPMLDNSIAAAAANGATVFLPAPIYSFGPDAWPVLRADSPQNPLTRKGKIRTAMEERLRGAAVRSIVLRAGDYFGARGTGNTWFAAMLNAARSRLIYPGPRGLGHAWAYLPDVGETAAHLITQRDAQAPHASFNMAGHWDADGTELIAAVRAVLGKPRLPVWRFPWALLPVMGVFMPFMREMQEMAYLWREPLRLDNSHLAAAIGGEAHTPWVAAVAATLRK